VDETAWSAASIISVLFIRFGLAEWVVACSFLARNSLQYSTSGV
jgi:hypothetical protein